MWRGDGRSRGNREAGRALGHAGLNVTCAQKLSLLGPLLVNLIAYVGQRAQIVSRQLKDRATAEKHVRAARDFHGALAET